VGTAASEMPDHRQAHESYAEGLAVLEPLQQAGLLKGTRYADGPKLLRDRIAACRRVEDTLGDMNAAFKYPPKITRELLLLRAKELARMKKLDDATTTADRLAGVKDALGEALFAAARAHGCTAAVPGAMPDQHAEQALKLLRHARRRGCFDLPANRKLLEAHRDFEPLRKRPDFAKLQAEVAADTGRLVLEKNGELRLTDPPDTELKKSPCQVHEIELAASKRYAIALDRAAAAKFDPFLRLEDAAGKELARDDDSGGDLNAFLVYIPAQTARYRIIVTSFDGTAGGYALTVRER
jgi:hypothetical protein